MVFKILHVYIKYTHHHHHHRHIYVSKGVSEGSREKLVSEYSKRVAHDDDDDDDRENENKNIYHGSQEQKLIISPQEQMSKILQSQRYKKFYEVYGMEQKLVSSTVTARMMKKHQQQEHQQHTSRKESTKKQKSLWAESKPIGWNLDSNGGITQKQPLTLGEEKILLALKKGKDGLKNQNGMKGDKDDDDDDDDDNDDDNDDDAEKGGVFNGVSKADKAIMRLANRAQAQVRDVVLER
jgi:hypothetical protein